MLRRKKRGKRESLEKRRCRVKSPVYALSQGERSSQRLGVPQREKKKIKKGRRRRVRGVNVKREGVRRSKRRQKKRSGVHPNRNRMGGKDKGNGRRLKNLRARKQTGEAKNVSSVGEIIKKLKKKSKRKKKYGMTKGIKGQKN